MESSCHCIIVNIRAFVVWEEPSAFSIIGLHNRAISNVSLPRGNYRRIFVSVLFSLKSQPVVLGSALRTAIIYQNVLNENGLRPLLLLRFLQNFDMV